MEDVPFASFQRDSETQSSNFAVPVFEWEKDVKLDQENKDPPVDEQDEDSLVDSMLCDSNSRLIPSGFTAPHPTGPYFCFSYIYLPSFPRIGLIDK